MDKPDPEAYQPPLTRWGNVWRVLVMLAISGVVYVEVVEGQWEDHRWLFWTDVAIGIAAFVAVFFRRRRPMTIAVVLAVVGIVSATAAGPAALAAISVATRRVYWQIIVLAVLNIVSAQAFTTLQPLRNSEPYLLTLGVNITVIAAFMAWGMFIGSRRELLWTLRNRAERAESEQDLRVGQARSNERARIAREMHDVLAHRISQISLHAGALGFRNDLSAAEMRSGATVIQEKAHEALSDLRGVLGVLRDDETGVLLSAPQPTYADLPVLVDEARDTGLNVRYADRLDEQATVPDVVGRTLYRIIQEGITNARKHAPGAELAIELSGSPDDGIDITLRNPIGFGPTITPGSGLGLVGLSERAELRGGRLEHRRDGTSFVLHAWIPWAA